MSSYKFVAEAGTNHLGSEKFARKLIYLAKGAGFSAIKFQMYYPKNFDKESQPFLAKARLDMVQVHSARKECERVGIEFFCSVFDRESLAEYLEISERKHWVKIPSSRIHDDALIEAAFKSDRRCVLSTGLTDLDRLKEIAEQCPRQTQTAPVICHCISAYPTSMDDRNLATLGLLKDLFGPECIYGYSDHTMDSDARAASMAIAMGARYIEHHISLPDSELDRDLIHPMERYVSFWELGATRYITSLQDAVSMLGTPRQGVYDCEKSIKKKYVV